MSGPAAEELFCGPITDGSGQIDYQMARRYLARQFDPLRIEVENARVRAAADRLVRTPSVQDRIRRIAAALLRHGTIAGDEIGVMIAADA